MEFLENKIIFMIGAIGFLGKVMIEKILRLQPGVNKLYLLVRSVDEIMATKRFYNEVADKDLFKVLKEKWGGDLNTLFSEKICLVPGDISHPNMGLKSSNLLEDMKNKVEIIVNFAATTNFDERYDVAFETNTLGPKHVLSFAKQCSNLQVLVHVSTAYVSGEKKGLILETLPYKMGDENTKLNIESEQKLVEETLNELKKNRSTMETITSTMKSLGRERSKIHGWPNTYVFTKAMGEMIISDLKDNLPLIIIRPSMVTSTYKEPFPGWIEGARTIDSIIIGYAKGKLTRLPCDLNSIIDIVPADIVVNTIIVTMVAHKLQSSREIIYHVGSSMKNPIKVIDFGHFIFQYFTENPWINKDGDAVEVKKIIVYNDMASFHRYMTTHYLVFLKGLKFANKIICHSFQDKYIHFQRKFNWVMRLAELYRPYLFFKARFDDANLERLRIVAQDNNTNLDALFLSPKDINWEDYLMNIHIPGLLKYVMR